MSSPDSRSLALFRSHDLSQLSIICTFFYLLIVNINDLSSADQKNDPHSPIRSIEPDGTTGTSRAIVVDDVPLAHTSQILPLDKQGKVVEKNHQIDRVFRNLETMLVAVGSKIDQLVKLNIYVADENFVPKVQKSLAARFHNRTKPAVSYVVTPLRNSAARIALDAIAVTSAQRNKKQAVPRIQLDSIPTSKSISHVSVLPAGRTVYISGQAAKGTLAEATRKTMEGLHETLKHMGLKPENVVQVKSFLQPVSDISTVENEIAKFYPDGLSPALSYVEWISSSPIEIEMIAHWPATATTPKSTDAAEYITPPWMKSSPVFSRVAIIHHGRRIYVSSLVSRKKMSQQEQVNDVFNALNSTLTKAGSDMKHLVKGTYYVTDGETSAYFGKTRLTVYDPKRPPAASKATVKSVGFPGRTLSLDMIAVQPR